MAAWTSGATPLSARELSLVMATYGQPRMLDKWFETLRAYDDDVLDRLHLVIVDDHGDPPVVIPDDIQVMLGVRLYRVESSIPWNQMGARNLGAQEATTGWMLLLDPDMVVEPIVARRLLDQIEKMHAGEVVKLLLRYTNDVFDSSSPNVYLMHKNDFERIGGYDEDYAGQKGWSDVQFLHTLNGFSLQFLRPEDLWVRYYRPRDIVDATVQTLDRDVKVNRVIHLRKYAQGKQMGWQRWVQKNKGPNLRFRWQRLL